ncbi:aminodeoxychorismate synthase component I [Bacillus sp. T33-2]|uniref:aminodeoxychorismate synthase component I n=1 Tax=Bacillus sp. T33-2 TaxID=2054168 RepID=UPI000C78CC54|nr:aminodeoxychorismate synthase component I [Bacillus sp. T33-2]PLR95966.1 aminodeoxychorismate synthase, component I [Bacillus sp. T33-2]
MLNNKQNMLHFEFADDSGKVTPLTFSNPEEIIIARTIDEVIPCLQRVQDAVESGLYAAGYITYEAAPAFDDAFLVNEQNKMPLLWFGLFSKPGEPVSYEPEHYSVAEWLPDVDIEEYRSRFHKIKQYIKNGDTYQVNYTIRLNSTFKGDDFSFFKQLAKGQSANYCAYISTEEHSILSASPELFFHLQNNKVTTRPMKGTIQRGKTYQEDLSHLEQLSTSEKNRSENLMIVDLLRNDLGIIAEPGSVEVPSLFSIEQYPTVYQMTSTVTANLSPQTTITDIFKALFPCGSITGAPKISTMKFISELEKSPREVYCGAIGYITPKKEAIFNVPIRTVIIEKSTGKAEYGVGGGITWDSTEEDEYHEIITKAALLQQNRPDFELLESLNLKNGHYFLLNEHLDRMKKSAEYFGFAIGIENVAEELQKYALTNVNEEQKVRLLVSKDGQATVEGAAITASQNQVTVALADHPIKKDDIFLYHKTTNRQIYSSFKGRFPEAYDVLLWNEQNELTEFTTGNVVLEIEGELFTPYVESGLLPGTFRKHLLENNQIHERTLTISDLKICTNLWLINSVRKWVNVKHRDGWYNDGPRSC